MPAFSVTSVGGSNTNTLGSEAVNISRSADGDLQISYAGSLASISRDQIPQGYANFKIDRNAVANLAKVIESLKEINAESCPPKYFPAEIGSPTVRKNYYFYLWLATKALAKSGDPINSDCNKLGTIFKARVNAMDKIGELEKDLENKIKGNTGDYVNMQKILTLINDGSLPMNDSDKVTVLVALHYLICCAPNTNFDQRYGSLFLSTAFDISAPAIKALCDILNKDSQALKNVSERIFSVDQQNKLQIIQALYQNSKEGNYVIGQDLRRREQYTAAENLFAKQYESYIVESRKGLPTAELKKIDQKFDEEIEKITKQTNVAIAKETNPKLKELIAGQGTIKIHQAEKQRAITVLDKYFELKPKSANNNDREAREAFMAFKNMSDPLDEWLTVTDANAAIGKEILKEVAIITASSLAGNVVAGAGSRLVLLGARVSRSPVAMAKITAALVSFSLSAGTFTTVENLLSKNPNWSKEHYLNTFIMFAVLAGAGQVGRVMETSTGKRLAKMFEPQLEKIFSSKILTASMNITLRGLPKGLSFSESALSLSLYQIASTPELAQQLMQAMLSSNPNSNVSVMDIMGQVISNNVVFLMGLKTAGALTSIPMIKAKLAETPALQSKLDRVVAEYEAAKIVTVEKRKESFSDLLKVLSDVLEIEPVNESKITPAQMAVLHEFVMDLQLHADNGGKEVSPNRIYELLQDMTHRLLTSNERHTRTILREMLPSMKETIGVDEIYIYEAEPYVSKFSFFNRGISSEKIEKEKAFAADIEKLIKQSGVQAELFLKGHLNLQLGENYPPHLKGFQALMNKYNVKTLLIKSFWEKDTFVGNIIFINTKMQKKWEENEIFQIRTIKEIVFASLSKYKNYKKAKFTQMKIKELNQSLESTNLSLEESIGIFHHDVRGKLGAILMLTQMMQENPPTDTQAMQKQIGMINTSATEVLNMAKLYLAAEKAKMSNIVLDEKPLYLERDLIEPLIMQAKMNIESYQKTNPDRDLSITYEIEPNLNRSVFLDKTLTLQILENLVGNAIKYSKKGSIRLHVSKVNHSSQDYLRFKLTDCGSGISAENIKKIFTFGFQVDKKSQGLGMGLSFVQKLVKAMGGHISVESNTQQAAGASSGSTFTVDIPNKEFLGQ